MDMKHEEFSADRKLRTGASQTCSASEIHCNVANQNQKTTQTKIYHPNDYSEQRQIQDCPIGLQYQHSVCFPNAQFYVPSSTENP